MKSLMCENVFDVKPCNPPPPAPPPTRQQFWEKKYKLAFEMSRQNFTYTPPPPHQIGLAPPLSTGNCAGKRPSLRLGPSSCNFLKNALVAPFQGKLSSLPQVTFINAAHLSPCSLVSDPCSLVPYAHEYSLTLGMLLLQVVFEFGFKKI
jgi:hypothetical protein